MTQIETDRQKDGQTEGTNKQTDAQRGRQIAIYTVRSEKLQLQFI